ncbi:hypothetical protein VTN77DRAFT_7529 [Rasamsonia byssochlamydoides]|uniref:uncharacterized protein n=1 Tax=Rasamsonia byssochlamydoides TaxID=89139 RepID=UPI003743B2F0
MDKAERLRLLFEDDDFLLNSNTGLHPPASAVEPATTQMESPPAEKDAPGQVQNPIPLPSESCSVAANDTADEIEEHVSTCNPATDSREDAVNDNYAKPNKVETKHCGGEKSPVLQPGLENSAVSLSQYFCPLLAVSRLPYKYIYDKQSYSIANRFFDKGKFWQRQWDLYYIIPPEDISPRPLLLVPAVQVQQLMDEINDSFKTESALSMDPDLGLFLPFQEDGTPQPQFLGQCTSREMKEQLETSIPKPMSELGDENAQVADTSEADGSFAAFREKIQAGVQAAKNRTKAAKEKKRTERIQRHREWTRSLKRTQCYLGLRPRRPQDLHRPVLGENATEEEMQEAEREYGLACGTILLPLELNDPAPFPFAREPIFICVDIESNERCHEQITEIGVSTLDTLDLVGVAPGEGGKNWIDWIRSRHFRIKERAHIVNHDYVSGCPNRFDFGQSEWIPLESAAKMVDECFQPPYSAHVAPKIKTEKQVRQEASVTIEETVGEHKLRPRNIVLVGHDIDNDIEYLRSLGCSLFEAENSSANTGGRSHTSRPPTILEALDTATLFQVLKRDTCRRSLGVVLADLQLVGWNLHNAGNDARYTLEAMIRIALTSRLLLDGDKQQSETGSTNWALGSQASRGGKGDFDIHVDAVATAHESAWKAEVERRVAESVAESEMRIRDECKIWEIATGWEGNDSANDDDVDGGDAGGITIRNAKDGKRVRKGK